MVICLFVFQEIGAFSRKTQKPDMIFLCLHMLPSQHRKRLANWLKTMLGRRSLGQDLDLRYLRIRCTIFRCVVCCLETNWLNLWTAKIMSGLDNVMRCRSFPMSLLHWVMSARGSPSWEESLFRGSMGISAGLHAIKPNSSSRCKV